MCEPAGVTHMSRTTYQSENLSNMDTFGTKIIVLISEVSLFLGEDSMYLYKVGTQSNVLINQLSFKRGSTVQHLLNLPLSTKRPVVPYN